MRPNVVCSKCDETGIFREWKKSDPSRRGGWRHEDIDCPNCGGFGKHPDRSWADGYFAVHSERASHYSVDELLDILEIPNDEEGISED